MGNVHTVGASIDLIKKTEFEIDHFLYEKASIFATKRGGGYTKFDFSVP